MGVISISMQTFDGKETERDADVPEAHRRCASYSPRPLTCPANRSHSDIAGIPGSNTEVDTVFQSPAFKCKLILNS